jgi:hypothetical protein
MPRSLALGVLIAAEVTAPLDVTWKRLACDPVKGGVGTST